MINLLRKPLGRALPRLLADDAEAAGLRGTDADEPVVAEADIRALPEPAQRYLRFMGVVGRPQDRAFRARLSGRFRMRPGQRAMPFEAWQYNTRLPVARLFHMRLDFGGFAPVIARDAYVDGHGRMRGKLLGLVPVVDGHGPEFDVSELVTWLNDAVMLCPSMLLDAATTWSAADASAFDVAFTDAGTTVRARVFVDERGAPRDFGTTDRFAALPGGLVRAEWTTPVDHWDLAHGRPVPDRVAAVWHLAEGPFPYVEGGFDPAAIEYNDGAGDTRTEAAPPTRVQETREIVAALPSMLTAPIFRRQHLRWGATDEEVGAPMPGDELVPLSHFTATRAITIAARPGAVWPWLMQVGVGRGGFYSYDLLDNLGRPSAEEPLPQWQTLQAGDLVAPMTNPPTAETSFVVHSLEPNRSVVWSKPDSTWVWTLTPLAGDRTRLVTRLKQRYRPSIATVVTVVLSELGDFAMMRKMLLGIKRRAEQHPIPNPEEEPMDDAEALALLGAERARVEMLLGETVAAGVDDRAAAAEAGDMTDPAPALISEQADDAVAAGLRDRLDAITRAERRLEDGTYGRSVRSGTPIPDERLRADPAAELTVEEARAAR